jgi:hypothetical protein
VSAKLEHYRAYFQRPQGKIMPIIEGCFALFYGLPPDQHFTLELIELEEAFTHVIASGTSDGRGMLALHTTRDQARETLLANIQLNDKVAIRLRAKQQTYYCRKHAYTGLRKWWWGATLGNWRAGNTRHSYMLTTTVDN